MAHALPEANRIVAFIRREPVATAMAPIIGVLVVYGVARGWVTSDTAPLILAGASIVLGVPVTLGVRSQVTPSVKVSQVPTMQVAEVIGTAASALNLAPEHKRIVDALVAQVKYNLPGL